MSKCDNIDQNQLEIFKDMEKIIKEYLDKAQNNDEFLKIMGNG